MRANFTSRLITVSVKLPFWSLFILGIWYLSSVPPSDKYDTRPFYKAPSASPFLFSPKVHKTSSLYLSPPAPKIVARPSLLIFGAKASHWLHWFLLFIFFLTSDRMGAQGRFIRWVQSQGRSPHASGITKNTFGPVGIPFFILSLGPQNLEFISLPAGSKSRRSTISSHFWRETLFFFLTSDRMGAWSRCVATRLYTLYVTADESTSG